MASLSLLDRAVQALRTCVVDDIHAGSQFAEFLGVLIHRLRGRMIRVAARNKRRSASASTTTSNEGRDARPSKPRTKKPRSTSESHPKGFRGAGTPGRQPSAYVPSGNPHDVYGSPGFGALPPQAYTRADVPMRPQEGLCGGSPDLLKGIHTPIFNHQNPEYSIMPPPSFNGWSDVATTAPHAAGSPALNHLPPFAGSPAAAHAAHAHAGQSFTMQQQQQQPQPQQPSNPFGFENYDGSKGAGDVMDWYVLPIDPLFSDSHVDVAQTGQGPNVDGHDMLELLLMDPNDHGEARFGESVPGTH